MKKISYTKKAMKDLAKMPRNTQQNVRAKINQYADNPASLANNVIKMTGEVGYRLRVGSYRVRFDENDTVIDILRVLPRGEVYKR